MKLGPYFEHFLVCVMVGYGIASFLLYKKQYVNESRNLMLWMKAIVYTYLAFCLAWAAYYYLVDIGVLLVEHDYIITFFMILFIALTTYFGIEHPRIFNGKPMKELIPFIKYEKTGLSKKLSMKWKQNLDNYMIQKRPYLDGELRLDDLSEGLGYSRHHTSQIINEHYKMNFFEFINLHRIREAAELLQNTNTKELQITEIAYQVGFNNRTSFYKAFNKEYGVTPSQFRKNFLHQNTMQ
jgi:AraC-like DNA-binding protein